MIAEEADRGDSLSYEVIMELATWLGLGIVTLMHTIDPGAVILGGAMNFGGHEDAVGRRFIEQVRSVVRKHAFPIPAQRTVIDFASLGSDAGYIGAAGIARLEYHKRQADAHISREQTCYPVMRRKTPKVALRDQVWSRLRDCYCCGHLTP